MTTVCRLLLCVRTASYYSWIVLCDRLVRDCGLDTKGYEFALFNQDINGVWAPKYDQHLSCKPVSFHSVIHRFKNCVLGFTDIFDKMNVRSLKFPQLTPRYHGVPRRYEETRPVVIQDFTHRKIIGEICELWNIIYCTTNYSVLLIQYSSWSEIVL